MQRSRRFALAGLLGAGFLGAATWIAVSRIAGPKVPVARVTRGPLVQTIVTTGRVRPPARATLAPLVAGKVTELGADEGDTVKAGQVLLVLDDTEARAVVQQAEARVTDIEVQGKQVRTISSRDAAEAVKRARTRLDDARRTHARIQSLYTDGIANRETLEEAGTALSLAESELRAAQIQRKDVRGTRSDRIDAARRQAEAELSAARARLGHHRVTSPFDGTVVERGVELGDIASAGSPAFVVVRAGETELVVEPDERNLALLALGQSAVASAEAFPDQRFDARVSYIAPVVDPRRGTIEVRLDVPSAPANLRPDMTVSVEIEVDRREDALTVPASAIRDQSSPNPWVLAVESGTTTRLEVDLGITGDDRIEITSGLDAGALVVPVGVDVRVGRRVRPQPEGE